MVTVGGVDTYYDYDEQCWKYRRLGGGRVHEQPLPADHLPKPKTVRPKQKHQGDTPARSSSVRV